MMKYRYILGFIKNAFLNMNMFRSESQMYYLRTIHYFDFLIYTVLNRTSRTTEFEFLLK